ncbi:MAG: type II toxin-antitoxin system VapC family toxin [Leadbetterella sp.]|nr:type II toxin-antitoxin system VapC family toxin [Leadbetterella sp.]
MSRYLLDTNILVFLVTGEADEVHKDVRLIIDDYNSHLAASSVSFAELIQLHRIGKIRLKKQGINEAIETLIHTIGVQLVPFTDKHINTLANLETIDGHNDPFDHAIIAHAITDRYTLISSDSKFKHYKDQNLNFVFNKR